MTIDIDHEDAVLRTFILFVQTALALLKNEAYLRQQLSSQLAQPAQVPETGALEGAFQRGVT